MTWARHPTAVALAVTVTTIAGLGVMLADEPVWKAAGFALAAAPVAAGTVAYLVHLRRR